VSDDEKQKSNGVKYALAGLGLAGGLSSPLIMAGGAVVIIIFGGLGVLLMPLIILIMIFGGGGSSGDRVDTGEQVVEIARSDGKGELAASQVPSHLVETLNDAGAKCGTISPIILAAQIETDSNWDAAKVGPDTKQGISQLPKAIFDKYGEDTDDNDKTQATDPKDSITAQAKHFCALAEQVQALKDSGQTTDNVLDMTLAAYHVGIDAVLEAKGVPADREALGYVVGVRSRFARYQGVGAPPTDYAVPTNSNGIPNPTTT
jgi:hypothetical protein